MAWKILSFPKKIFGVHYRTGRLEINQVLSPCFVGVCCHTELIKFQVCQQFLARLLAILTMWIVLLSVLFWSVIGRVGCELIDNAL